MGGGGGMGGGGMTTDAAEGWEGAKLGVCTLEPVGPREACNTCQSMFWLQGIGWFIGIECFIIHIYT